MNFIKGNSFKSPAVDKRNMTFSVRLKASVIVVNMRVKLDKH